MTERDKLNARVTDAVLEAERKLDEATAAWQEVADAEEALFRNTNAALLLERDIALAGTHTAQLTVKVLQSLGGRLPSKAKRTTLSSQVRQVATKDTCLECGAVTYHPEQAQAHIHFSGCSAASSDAQEAEE